MKIRKRIFLVSGFFWLLFLAVIFLTPAPKSFQSASIETLATFFTPLFGAIFFLLGGIFQNSRRSLLASAAVILALILQAMRVLNIFNFLLIAAVVVLLEMYLGNGKEIK